MAAYRGVVGSSLTIGSGSGQKIYGYNNIGAVPSIVAASNPLRQKIVFHNPGSVDVLIAPQFVQNTGSDAALTPGTANSSRGGCFVVYSNGGTLVVEGECTKPWQALSIDGSLNNPLTVMDSNV